MKNIHLINEEKITQRVIALFQRVDPIDSIFVVFSKTNKGYQYVNKADLVYSSADFSLKDERVDRIFIHFLDIQKVDFILKHFDLKTKIFWLVWGGDIYNRPEMGYRSISKSTFRLMFKLRPQKEFLKLITNPFRGNWASMGKIKRFSKNIDYLLTNIEQDAQLVMDKFDITPKFMAFNYYSIDEQSSVPQPKNNALNILLGNSGHPTNNHVDIIDFLSGLKEKFGTVYAPLNYGDELYSAAIVQYGQQKLGHQFVPILDFLPLKNYNELLGSCDVAIFNTYRQQAFGNIVNLIHLGKTVYLHPKNNLYEYLFNEHISVKSIQELKGSTNIPVLTEKERANNVCIAQSLFSECSTIRQAKAIISV